MSGRYWDGCRAAPVRLIGWTCAKKAFGLAFAAHIPDERLAALAHVHVLNACAAHAPARRKWPCRCRATEQRDVLAGFHVEHGGGSKRPNSAYHEAHSSPAYNNGAVLSTG